MTKCQSGDPSQNPALLVNGEKPLMLHKTWRGVDRTTGTSGPVSRRIVVDAEKNT